MHLSLVHQTQLLRLVHHDVCSFQSNFFRTSNVLVFFYNKFVNNRCGIAFLKEPAPALSGSTPIMLLVSLQQKKM